MIHKWKRPCGTADIREKVIETNESGTEGDASAFV
jgi:hypothetical protein